MNELIIDNLDCSAELQAVFKTANQVYEIQVPRTSLLHPYFKLILASASDGLAIRDSVYREIVPCAFLKFNELLVCGRGYSLDTVGPYIELIIDFGEEGFTLNFIFTEGK